MGAKDPERESMVEPNVINGCHSSRGSGSGPKGIRHNATGKERKNGYLGSIQYIRKEATPIAGAGDFFPVSRSRSRVGGGHLKGYRTMDRAETSLMERVLFNQGLPFPVARTPVNRGVCSEEVAPSQAPCAIRLGIFWWSRFSKSACNLR